MNFVKFIAYFSLVIVCLLQSNVFCSPLYNQEVEIHSSDTSPLEVSYRAVESQQIEDVQKPVEQTPVKQEPTKSVQQPIKQEPVKQEVSS